MADSLPSPPESTRSSPDATTDDLATRLDSLLEQHLGLLDQYTKLREDLSKTFSSGFFSLAQAQRTSTLGAGRRYGEEYYDERMKAQRKVLWPSGTDSEELDCKVVKVQKKDDSKSKKEALQQTSMDGSKGKEDVGEGKEQVRTEKEDQLKTSNKSTKSAKPKQDPATRDPLTWFGILVPPALRQTQTQFVKATEDQIPALVAVAARLRSSEQQIWAIREELGISSEYDLEEIEVEDEAVEAEQTKEEEKIESKRESNRSSRKPLTSRPARSKSHLLKLGD